MVAMVTEIDAVLILSAASADSGMNMNRFQPKQMPIKSNFLMKYYGCGRANKNVNTTYSMDYSGFNHNYYQQWTSQCHLPHQFTQHLRECGHHRDSSLNTKLDPYPYKGSIY
ncbi:hypothetical protein CHUAL_000078 [Chamberlinius hualienensis]